eukprot:jgi/Tetstr1/463712/TSEL_008571.t1
MLICLHEIRDQGSPLVPVRTLTGRRPAVSARRRNQPGALGINRHDRPAGHSSGAPRTANRALVCHERLTKLMEDELWDPEAPEQISCRQQHALKRDSARRPALAAAGIVYK